MNDTHPRGGRIDWYEAGRNAFLLQTHRYWFEACPEVCKITPGRHEFYCGWEIERLDAQEAAHA